MSVWVEGPVGNVYVQGLDRGHKGPRSHQGYRDPRLPAFQVRVRSSGVTSGPGTSGYEILVETSTSLFRVGFSRVPDGVVVELGVLVSELQPGVFESQVRMRVPESVFQVESPGTVVRSVPLVS